MTSYPNSPCLHCPERAPGCHARCENYLSYKQELEDFKAFIKAEKEKYAIQFIPSHEKWRYRK